MKFKEVYYRLDLKERPPHRRAHKWQSMYDNDSYWFSKKYMPEPTFWDNFKDFWSMDGWDHD